MPFTISNRLLWLAVIAGLASAYRIIPDVLSNIKTLATAPAVFPPPPQKRLQKDSENALTLDTLRTLADGYSYELRTSAIKIVASRSIRSRTRRLLLRDLRAKDYDRRDNAINGFWMLVYHPSLTDPRIVSAFVDEATFRSIVSALVNVLALHGEAEPKPFDSWQPKRVMHQNLDRNLLLAARKYDGDVSKLTGEDVDGAINRAKHQTRFYVTGALESESEPNPDSKEMPGSPVRPKHRPAHEVSLLILLSNLLRQNRSRSATGVAPIEHALKAGLVTRWLSVYPFPCTRAGNEKYGFKRSDVAHLFDGKGWPSDDPLMADVMYHVLQSVTGRKQMREAGLVGGRLSDEVDGARDWTRRSDWGDDWEDRPRDVRMVNGEETAGENIPARGEEVWEVIVRDHGRDHGRPERSREEVDLRRRNRQAVVMAENRGEPYVLQPAEINHVPRGPMPLRPRAGGTDHRHPPGEIQAQVTLSQNEAGELVIAAEGLHGRQLRREEAEAIMQQSLMLPEVRSVISGIVTDADLRSVHVRGGEQAITASHTEPQDEGGHDEGDDEVVEEPVRDI